MREPVIVTGASGYIGKYLVRELLNNNYEVHLILRRPLTEADLPFKTEEVIQHIHDGSTEGLIDIYLKAKPITTYHLASLFIAEHNSYQVKDLIESNVMFGTMILEAMAVTECKHLVNFGTSWQNYENKENNPLCLYAATKDAFNSIVNYYVSIGKVQVVTLKLFDTYGRVDNRKKLLPYVKENLYTNIEMELTKGEQLIDLVYIDDVIEAAIMAADRCKLIKGHEVYGVSTKSGITLKGLFEIIRTVTDTNLITNFGAKPYRNREVMTLWSNYQWVPGWKPKTDLACGLRKYFDDEE